MPFCDICERNIKASINANGDSIVYHCVCGNIKPTNPDETLIWESSNTSGNTISLYERFIHNAAFDPTNTVVKKQCPTCPLNYMVMVQLGKDGTTIYRCKYCNI